MPVTTRSRFRNMFTGTPPTGSEEATTNAPQSTSRQALSPLERILDRLDSLVSRATSSPTPTTYSSRPGPNMEAGRNDIGGRIGLEKGPRASPIARASSPGQPGDDVSHYL